jgi:hypothetical protein
MISSTISTFSMSVLRYEKCCYDYSPVHSRLTVHINSGIWGAVSTYSCAACYYTDSNSDSTNSNNRNSSSGSAAYSSSSMSSNDSNSNSNSSNSNSSSSSTKSISSVVAARTSVAACWWHVCCQVCLYEVLL